MIFIYTAEMATYKLDYQTLSTTAKKLVEIVPESQLKMDKGVYVMMVEHLLWQHYENPEKDYQDKVSFERKMLYLINSPVVTLTWVLLKGQLNPTDWDVRDQIIKCVTELHVKFYEWYQQSRVTLS